VLLPHQAVNLKKALADGHFSHALLITVFLWCITIVSRMCRSTLHRVVLDGRERYSVS